MFNTERIRNQISRIENYPPREYYIGIDSYSDENESAFCLGYKKGNSFVILLAKTERNKDSFNEEVNNLMKYFNAKKIEMHG